MRVVLKTTVVLLCTFLTLLAVLAYAEVREEVEHYEGSVLEDLAFTGRALRAVLDPSPEGPAHALGKLGVVELTSRQGRARWVAIDDPSLTPFRADLERGEEVAIIDRHDGEYGRAYVRVPVPHEGHVPGCIQLSQSLATERALIRTIVVDQLVASVGTGIGATLIAMLVGVWFVGRPIQALVAQADRIGAGDLTTRLGERRKDEIGQLARAMDGMCDRLIDAQARVTAETQARIQAIEQLRHADRLMTVGKLASGIAHELGTPLNVVSGRAKMIASGKLAPDQVETNAKIVMAQADRITKIIRQLLDFARRGEPKKGPVDLGALVRQSVALLEPLAKKRGLDVAVDVDAADAKVPADASQVEQVLTNLLVNAMHAMPEPGTIALEVRRADVTPPVDVGGARASYVTVAVTDAGTGIAPDVLPRIFEPFFTTKEVGEGTGLGLSVAYGIMRDHGGWIGVTSELGRGTTFTLYFPTSSR